MALAGCLSSNGPIPMDPDQPYPGMLLVKSKNQSFPQGAVGELAAPLESPVIINSFSYDYWMDATEVTQFEFGRLMGWQPVPAASPYGSGATHPVYQVTWYDAALYCNARSRQQGLDTVYAFTRMEKGATGSVYALEGLSIRMEKTGFRLPTEAEWEYAAKAGSVSAFTWGDRPDPELAGKYAWFLGNAGNTTHPVAGRTANAYGFHDMAGNVMEWVNDWKGAYPPAGTVDFTGARDPGPEFEMPVKGGAFPYGLRTLRPANRSATYATIPSAAAEYVGFRCVSGSILQPRFTSPDGQWMQTDPVALSTLQIPRGLDGRLAKLAFINATPTHRHLAYVDYAHFPPQVLEFTDIHNAFYPAISPDGNWVAFATGLEGSAQGSELYIRKLDGSRSPSISLGHGFIPRWWVDAAARDTFLLYTNSAVSNLEERWKTTQTLMQKIQGGKPAGSPSVLTSDGGFHDGRSYDGRYLATGFQNLRLRNLDGNQTRVLFTAPDNGKAEGDTSQVCNVSLSPDASGRTLFLDFGSPIPSRLTGSAYGIHQFAFMADTLGKVLRWFRAPPEEESWDELEWSNHPDFAVSSAKNAAGQHRNLYLLNLKDGSTFRLAGGTTLIQTALWVDPAPAIVIPGGINPDSLGHYNDPAATGQQTVFSSKMKRFWKGHQEWELVALGSSHAHLGIDPHQFSRLRSFNFSYAGQGLLASKILALDYAVNHCPKLKAVIVEIFPGTLSLPGGDAQWNGEMGATKGYVYDLSHQFWKGGLPPQFAGLMQKAPNGFIPGMDSSGWETLAGEGWGTDPPPQGLRNDWGRENAEYQKNLAEIRLMAQSLADRKIHLWLVNFPESPAYKNTSYYQRYGPGWEAARDIMEDMREMEKISPFVHFYDAYNFGDHDYAAEDANDWDHLSPRGAAKLSRRLDSLINASP